MTPPSYRWIRPCELKSNANPRPHRDFDSLELLKKSDSTWWTVTVAKHGGPSVFTADYSLQCSCHFRPHEWVQHAVCPQAFMRACYAQLSKHVSCNFYQISTSVINPSGVISCSRFRLHLKITPKKGAMLHFEFRPFTVHTLGFSANQPMLLKIVINAGILSKWCNGTTLNCTWRALFQVH